MSRVTVKLAERSYPIVIGTGDIGSLNRLLCKHLGQDHLFLFYDARFYALHGPALRDRLDVSDRQLTELVIPSGEKYKSWATLKQLYDFLLSQRISRTDLIVACGGGVVTDLVGYVAATVLRGVRWAAVPTTLVGMVDAGIGGKTGINHTRGKNLVGTFWQPVFVHADVTFLQTLDFRQMTAGLGEMVKYCGLIGPAMINPLATYLAHDDLYRQKDLVTLIHLSAKYKATIVTRDERESNVRMFLNFGHTFAHAIEHTLGYGQLLHGETVLLGILAALELAGLSGEETSEGLVVYRKLVEHCVAMVPRRQLSASAILEAMMLDKKRRGGDQKYVLLTRPGKPIITEGITRRLVRRAIERMLAFYGDQGGTYAHHSAR